MFSNETVIMIVMFGGIIGVILVIWSQVSIDIQVLKNKKPLHGIACLIITPYACYQSRKS